MEQQYDTTTATHNQSIPKEISILQSLNTLIHLHFEKTLEKKKAIDLQKKYLWKLFHIFFIFLSLVLFTLTHHSTKLQCRHCWIPITFLSLSHLIFYVSVSQTIRCINGFKYQRRCHKLTLCLATEKLRQLKGRMMISGGLGFGDEEDGEFEIQYQEPDESYFGKFKRNWGLYFGFLVVVYVFMVSSSVVLLCF
ncbi:unnamed protein product [Rhodiola kirilowii]